MKLRLSPPDDQLREQFLTLERPQDIADLLEISYPLLQYWLFIAPPTDKYITFMLHKASGGLRIISAPTTTLKIIQQKLNQVLQAVYEVKKPVHGFVIGKSIVTNALAHAKQHYVFNIDLQDFFPSINFGRVRGLFMGKPYNLPANVATVLAQICCHENALPQGAPTSPIIANMICGQLDDQLLSLAKKHGCRYTRYADDITFSSSRLIFAPTIATSEYKVQSGIGKISWQIGSELETLIQDNGFKVNLDKVRMQTINQHQEVTGLTTNEFPNVNRQYIRQIRAMLHAWEKYGSKRAHQDYYNQHVQGQRGPYKDAPPFKQIVKGKIEFLGMVRGRDNPIYQRFLQQYRSLAPRNVQTKSLRSAPASVETPQRFNFPQWIETLPFPLASILRVYDVDDDDKEKFDHLLKFFEALTIFWAIILLSSFYSDEAEFKKLLSKLRKNKASSILKLCH